MTIKGRIEDTKNKEVKIQTLENFLDKSREMQSEALVMGWKETKNIAQCSLRNQ